MSARTKGIFALAFVLVAWSFSSPVVKYLMLYYDPWTQNAYRYAAGMLTLLPLLARRLRREPGRLNRRALLWLLAPALPNIVHQTAWVVALLWIFPALSSFLNKSSVLFAALMAYWFFPEERWLFRSKRFLGGVALTMLGTLGLALLRPDLNQMRANFGVLLALVAAAGWSLYGVAAKRPVEKIGSMVSFAVVSIYTTTALFPMALVWGNLASVRSAPWHVSAVMFASGVFLIGLAHTAYFYAIKQLGVSVCATMLLMTPLGTMLLSRWMFDERLATGQLAGGAILLAGGALTLLAKKKLTPVELTRAMEV